MAAGKGWGKNSANDDNILYLTEAMLIQEGTVPRKREILSPGGVNGGNQKIVAYGATSEIDGDGIGPAKHA